MCREVGENHSWQNFPEELQVNNWPTSNSQMRPRATTRATAAAAAPAPAAAPPPTTARVTTRGSARKARAKRAARTTTADEFAGVESVEL